MGVFLWHAIAGWIFSSMAVLNSFSPLNSSLDLKPADTDITKPATASSATAPAKSQTVLTRPD
jgi:hypothetical protein